MITLFLSLSLLLGDPEPPSVLLFILDDVGVDRLGCYGDTEAHTPNIDALAASGARFTNAYSETVCSPTRTAALTGQYPHTVADGISNAIAYSDTDPGQMVPFGIQTLPDAIPATYVKVALGKWHMANSSFGMTHPLAMGFDVHYGTIGNPQSYSIHQPFLDGVQQNTVFGYLTTHYADVLVDVVELAETPYFVWMGWHAPHSPFHKPPSGLHTYTLPPVVAGNERVHYRAALEAVDTEIGRVLAEVDTANTYVFVVGDNGTPVEAVDDATPPWQSKGFVYDGGVHVPLVVVGPGIDPGDRTGLVHVVDIAPTIAELCGGSTAAFPDGRGFADALFTDPSAGRLHAYCRRTVPIGSGPYSREEDALRWGAYKLVRDLWAETEEFYDISADPGETTDLLDGELTGPQQTAYNRMLNAIANIHGE